MIEFGDTCGGVSIVANLRVVVQQITQRLHYSFFQVNSVKYFRTALHGTLLGDCFSVNLVLIFMYLWNEWIQWVFSLLNQFISGILQSTGMTLEGEKNKISFINAVQWMNQWVMNESL